MAALLRRGHLAVGWSRSTGFDLTDSQLDSNEKNSVNEGDSAEDWIQQLHGIDAVIHLAAHVHAGNNNSQIESERHRQINYLGTLRLAKAALTAGVRRFIFLSTAKVFGEGEDGPYSSLSPARPQDAYAQSKWEAEQGLRQLTDTTPMELVIIRPPLVYGPGVSANFARLIQLARLPLPLPLANIDNRRDMIGIDNLVDLVAACIDQPAAAGAVLLCSDGAPYSLGAVVENIRRAHGRPGNLFSLPAGWVSAVGGAVLGHAAARRLFGNFELDIAATCTTLGWRPQRDMTTILSSAGCRPW
jgi:UDP-N-acetyl-alpha-D-quinovosamine dehydrogenase